MPGYDPGTSIWNAQTGVINPVEWDAQGRPFRRQVNGKPNYIPPAVAVTERDDARLRAWGEQATRAAPHTGGFTDRSRTWNSGTGEWDRGSFFDSPIGGLVLGGGAMAAPYVASAIGGIGGGGGGVASGSGVGIGETAATTGLASGAGLPGAVAAPSIAGAGTAAAGSAPLASSQIGTGYIPAVGGSPSGAMGGGMGALDRLKQVYDLIDRGSQAADVAGRLATNVGAQRQGDRLMEANANERQDVLRQRAAQMLEDAMMNRADLDLQRRRFSLSAPGQRAANSMRGDILANAQDASVSGPITGTRGQVPTISGGLRPSMLSANSRALGGQMSRQALLSQMQGDNFTPMPAPQIPGVTPLPQAGRVDRVLNWIGGTGNTIGALDEAGLFGGNGPLAQSRQPRIPELSLSQLNPWDLPGRTGGLL